MHWVSITPQARPQTVIIYIPLTPSLKLATSNIASEASNPDNRGQLNNEPKEEYKSASRDGRNTGTTGHTNCSKPQ
jgi:hypothetical protein